MDAIPDALRQPFVELIFSIADDKLMLGSRNADWTGLAPILEEDIAFSALAQDDIAHAGALYELIASVVGGSPDQLAFGRTPQQYRCAQLVEVSDAFDWAAALARQFFCDHLNALRIDRLRRSCFRPAAALAARIAAEQALSTGHADSWIVRLARGTEESRQRLDAALRKLAPLTGSLFEPTEGVDRLEAAAIYPASSPPTPQAWRDRVEALLRRAGIALSLPEPDLAAIGGRRGRHSSEFAALLDELTEVYRVEPEAAW